MVLCPGGDGTREVFSARPEWRQPYADTEFEIRRRKAAPCALGHNDVVEMAWDLQAALFAVRSVSYTEGLFHAGLIRGPRVDGMLAPAMSIFAAG